jgi:hypothetical protein
MLFRVFEKRRGEEGGKQTWHDAFEVFGTDIHLSSMPYLWK